MLEFKQLFMPRKKHWKSLQLQTIYLCVQELKGRSVMGYLGNKGCISVSMSVHQTSFCFMCSHLASEEKEGEERRRNADVIEILKNTQFPRICKNSSRRRNPGIITDHNRVIWLGDLFITTGNKLYMKTIVKGEVFAFPKGLVHFQKNNGRVPAAVIAAFNSQLAGTVSIAPTLFAATPPVPDNVLTKGFQIGTKEVQKIKDAYAGETAMSKKKRRTPAWCDRILWYGEGIRKISYNRGESRFSDHRPVRSVFSVDVIVFNGRLALNMKVGIEELLLRSSSSIS